MYKIFDGKRYYPSGNGYYKTHDGIFLQRAIWEKYNGRIPKGYFVIFIDGNKENLDISNLEIISERLFRKNILGGKSKGKGGKIPDDEIMVILAMTRLNKTQKQISDVIKRPTTTIYDYQHGNIREHTRKYIKEQAPAPAAQYDEKMHHI